MCSGISLSSFWSMSWVSYIRADIIVEENHNFCQQSMTFNTNGKPNFVFQCITIILAVDCLLIFKIIMNIVSVESQKIVSITLLTNASILNFFRAGDVVCIRSMLCINILVWITQAVTSSATKNLITQWFCSNVQVSNVLAI